MIRLSRKMIANTVAIAALATSAFAARAEEAAPKPRPIVQIAILLDTSGSMEGLIEQAKTQLWKIVTEFAKTSRDGMRPDIEVALYHYGSPGLGQNTGYIKQLSPLTTDLDKISEELFKLRTSGGDEYCGYVIKTATNELKWSDDKQAYKAIFIAGNEGFAQGPVDFHEACKAAATKGVIVNTIYCGNQQAGISEKWDEGAKLADGTYMAIEQNKKVVRIEAPQDAEIEKLSREVNKTYIPYGKAGAAGEANQKAQDANAAGAGGNASYERAAAKASGGYNASNWDLADASKKDADLIKNVKDEDLPKEMQGKNEAERKQYVEEKLKERGEIQKKINELSEARNKYIAEKGKENSAEKSLDAAIIETVHKQAQNANLNFDKK
jgi:hypothetical protein